MKKALSIYCLCVIVLAIAKLSFDNYKINKMQEITKGVNNLVEENNQFKNDYTVFKHAVLFNLNKNNKDSLSIVGDKLTEQGEKINKGALHYKKELNDLAKLEPFEYVSKKLYIPLLLFGFLIAFFLGAYFD